MNLAARDLRRRIGSFVGTTVGLGLLFATVLSMRGIYAGLLADATAQLEVADADLWIVQRGTAGPFAEASRLDPDTVERVASVPGVADARAYTFATIQRDHEGHVLRMALVGIDWPGDRGRDLPVVAGRTLGQAHGELVADASLGLPLAERIRLGDTEYRVVGLTRGMVGTAGDAAVFATVADAVLIVGDVVPEAIRLERERRADRLLATDLGVQSPGLVALLVDPRWRAPALPDPAIGAVLARVEPGRTAEALRALETWDDVDVLDRADEERLLLQGMVSKARMQLGLFSVLLTVTGAVIVALVQYNAVVDKTHDIAILKLLGARPSRIAVLVLQQAWLHGAIGYAVAVVVGTIAFPHFPRRVVLTGETIAAGGVLVLVVVTVSSLAGVVRALRVDVGRVLEA